MVDKANSILVVGFASLEMEAVIEEHKRRKVDHQIFILVCESLFLLFVLSKLQLPLQSLQCLLPEFYCNSSSFFISFGTFLISPVSVPMVMFQMPCLMLEGSLYFFFILNHIIKYTLILNSQIFIFPNQTLQIHQVV